MIDWSKVTSYVAQSEGNQVGYGSSGSVGAVGAHARILRVTDGVKWLVIDARGGYYRVIQNRRFVKWEGQSLSLSVGVSDKGRLFINARLPGALEKSVYSSAVTEITDLDSILVTVERIDGTKEELWPFIEVTVPTTTPVTTSTRRAFPTEAGTFRATGPLLPSTSYRR